jgi:hypothetical protein
MDTVLRYLLELVRIALVGALFAVLWDGFDRWIARISHRLWRRAVFVMVYMSLGRPVIISRAYVLITIGYLLSLLGLKGTEVIYTLTPLASFLVQMTFFLSSMVAFWNRQNYLLPENRHWSVVVFVILFIIDQLAVQTFNNLSGLTSMLQL